MDLLRSFLVVIAVILVGVVVATAASWLAKPVWASRGRVIAIFVVAVLAAAALTVAAEAPDSSSSPATSSPSATVAAQAGTPTPVTVETTPPPAKEIMLTTMTPSIGATKLAAVPPEIASQAAYKDAVVIPCGSGNVGDQFPDVTYDLNGRYTEFHAGIYAYETKPEDFLVQLLVYPDQQTPVKTDVQIGQSGSVDVPVFGVTELRLEVRCQTPNADVILTGAYVVHE